jgi:hypothetical protein
VISASSLTLKITPHPIPAPSAERTLRGQLTTQIQRATGKLLVCDIRVLCLPLHCHARWSPWQNRIPENPLVCPSA